MRGRVLVSGVLFEFAGGRALMKTDFSRRFADAVVIDQVYLNPAR